LVAVSKIRGSLALRPPSARSRVRAPGRKAIHFRHPAQHRLHDGLVTIERTGRYHRVVQRSFAAAGFETRIVHPFVTKTG
jgi:hypothetical protein